MNVNKRSNSDKRTENVPKPERACGEAIVYAAPFKLSADTTGNFVKPNDITDAECYYTDKKVQKAVMHSSSAVIPAANNINIRRYGRIENNAVNAEGYEIENNKLNKLSVCFKLGYRTLHLNVVLSIHCDILLKNNNNTYP